MNPTELIRKKRDGHALTTSEMQWFLNAYLAQRIPDYQVSAMLMAIYFSGMSAEESKTWTEQIWKSGQTLQKAEGHLYIDKHSTGGIGDKPSLLLVPIVDSVCQKLGLSNVRIPMVSGRGLGHTGGTLDKLESVPGFNTQITLEEAIRLLSQNRFFMAGQTREMAPLDRLLYALRDVTATVESIPLIVGSILGKKLSENLDALVLNVTFGNGAFMKTEKAARELSEQLLSVARHQGIDTVAVLSRMDEPLGWSVGNFLEVEECYEYLAESKREKGLHEVVSVLAAWMVHLASRRKLPLVDCESEVEQCLRTARPLEAFEKMFRAQGGELRPFTKVRDSVMQGLVRQELKSEHSGFLSSMDAFEIGLLVHSMGGGRTQKEERVDPAVGIRFDKKVGEKVEKGERLATVFLRPKTPQASVLGMLREITKVTPTPCAPAPWIKDVIA